jgi:hypothetical protein
VRAPVVLGGIVAAVFLAPLGSALPALGIAASESSYAAYLANVLAGGDFELAFLTSFLFWTFVSGGVLDRYARNRPTRGTGFFAACGRHVGPLIRLALIVTAVETVVFVVPADPDGPAPAVRMALVILISIVATFARVRLVVEDRRSAIGSLLAGWRFVRRNLGAVLVCGLWAVLLLAAGYFGGMAEEAGGPAAYIGLTVLIVWMSLAWQASAIAFFQSRLAHADYTAAPLAVWPESAAAEAILNAPPAALP